MATISSSPPAYEASTSCSVTAVGVVGVGSVAGSFLLSSGPQSNRHGIPLVIPEGQLFYWTAKWQAEEHAAQVEINGGDTRAFKSGAEAVSWLLDAEDA